MNSFSELQERLQKFQDLKQEIEAKLIDQDHRVEIAKQLNKQSQVYKNKMKSILQQQQDTYATLKLEHNSIDTFNKNIGTILKSKQFNAFQLNKCLTATLKKLLCFV